VSSLTFKPDDPNVLITGSPPHLLPFVNNTFAAKCTKLKYHMPLSPSTSCVLRQSGIYLTDLYVCRTVGGDECKKMRVSLAVCKVTVGGDECKKMRVSLAVCKVSTSTVIREARNMEKQSTTSAYQGTLGIIS